MANNVYTRDDDQLTIGDASAHQINASSNKFVKVTLQASLDNNGTILVGGANPTIELVAGGSHSFENGFLNQIYYKGDTNGDLLNIHYEF
jgi:hypothetical protein